MDRSTGTALIAAALILGGSIVAAAYLVATSIDRGGKELSGVVAAAAARPAAAPARQAAAPRDSRPDPSRVYQIDVSGAPAKGPEDAPVTIVEWSDFQCPFCSRVTPTLAQVQETYGDRVRVVFKHLPLAMHPNAPAAHAAAEAAHRQGKFWEMHDRIFANQREMNPQKYQEYAREMGLDVERYDSDLAQVGSRIDADKKLAASLGITGTPSFFVNGRFLSGNQPFSSFQRMIDRELAN